MKCLAASNVASWGSHLAAAWAKAYVLPANAPKKFLKEDYIPVWDFARTSAKQTYGAYVTIVI
jgi:hypothetical protein